MALLQGPKLPISGPATGAQTSSQWPCYRGPNFLSVALLQLLQEPKLPLSGPATGAQTSSQWPCYRDPNFLSVALLLGPKLPLSGPATGAQTSSQWPCYRDPNFLSVALLLGLLHSLSQPDERDLQTELNYPRPTSIPSHFPSNNPQPWTHMTQVGFDLGSSARPRSLKLQENSSISNFFYSHLILPERVVYKQN